MTVHRLERVQLVARPLAEVFAFFSRAASLEQLTPTWLRFKLLTAEPIQMGAGRVIEYRLRVHGMPCDRRTPVQSTRSAIGERFDGAVPDGDSRRGAKAAPAFRWSTLGCASCLAKAGCTTAPGLWPGRF
jgi:hypothetical protein